MTESNKLDRLIHPLKSINAPSAKTLKRWDNASLKRHITAIGGVDAHAFKQSIMGFIDIEIFPYKVLFKSIRTHVLLDSPVSHKNKENYESDKDKILNALRTGRCFIANHYYGNARGFRFFAEYKGISYSPGEVINFSGGKVLLKVLAPKECTIKLIHNTEKILDTEGMNAGWDVNAIGIYRVECWIKDKGWIFSNHIRINNE
jgi:hypothetical protein